MFRRLDEVDISILDNLQQNGRMTNIELAHRAGISAPPCLRRLKNLENRGVIRGYHADLDGSAMGYNFVALCFVALENHSTKCVEQFLSHVRSLSNIRECASTTGNFDYVLKIIVRDLTDYEDFIDSKLKNFENIHQIKTYVIMQYNKLENGIPLL
ncbi:MAG: Lrp/AsnC family transcriptional regulator [Holosporales bacterium]|nr:Lrp/AsnC family transcriptional regulator [Holosporales bacterium]